MAIAAASYTPSVLHELTSIDRERLRPLFAGFRGRLHGCVEAIFTGRFGRAWADDPAAPTVALAHIYFWFVAGDPRGAASAQALGMVPSGGTIVTPGGAWDELVRQTLGACVGERTRTGFSNPTNGAWDRHRLRAMSASLPSGYSMRRVTAGDVESFARMEPDFIANFGSRAHYLAEGIGFGVWQGSRCVAGCSSYTLANGKLEIEIDTDPAFRRRGLARAAAATMILHCLDHRIEPCWDAHNAESAALAVQLGFRDADAYAVFVVA